MQPLTKRLEDKFDEDQGESKSNFGSLSSHNMSHHTPTRAFFAFKTCCMHLSKSHPPTACHGRVSACIYACTYKHAHTQTCAQIHMCVHTGACVIMC